MKAENGSVRRSFATSVVLAIMLAIGAGVWASNMDPCSVYPHQSRYLPQPASSATFTIVPGVLGKQIYVCSVEMTQFAGATPALRLSYGVQYSATPCATGSPYGSPVPLAGSGILGIVGPGANAGGTFIAGAGNYTLFGPVPAAASSPAIDLCIDGYNVNSVTVNYVQVP